MKAVILAGGKGTRLRRISFGRNKPMVRVGNIPLVFHVSARYIIAGFKDIYLLIGWRKEKFIEDFEDELKNIKNNPYTAKIFEDVKFHLVDTGEESDTFDRLKILNRRVQAPFIVTYGDTITDIDVTRVIKKYRYNQEKILAQVSITRPDTKYSIVNIDRRGRVIKFREKSGKDPYWVGCGFIVLTSQVFEKFENFTNLEKDVLPRLAEEGLVGAYKHVGLWQPVDDADGLRQAELKIVSKKIPSWILN